MAHMVKIEKGIYSLNGVVYGQKRVGGKLIRKKAPMQGALVLNSRGKPTPECRKWYQQWAEGLINEGWVLSHDGVAGRRKALTLGELIAMYREVAEVEYLEHAEPSRVTAVESVRSFKLMMGVMGLKEGDPLEKLTEDILREFIGVYLKQGVKRITAWNTLGRLRGLFAKWALARYRDRGYEVTLPEWPVRKHAGAPQYERPPDELRRKTLAWYAQLEERDGAMWVAVTMMLEFGMRNGDAERLEWKNFRKQNGMWVLTYQPNKIRTRTGGRSVNWPVSKITYGKLRAMGGKVRVIPGDAVEVLKRVTREMRELGWSRERYAKGAYELRKMCIDAVYTKMGLERAVQISGDNASTVSHYYLDPTRASLAAIPGEKLFEGV